MVDDGENQTAIIEYKPSCKSLVAEIHKYFLVQYVNGRRTEIRKCLSCSSLIKSVKSGTSAMQKHRNSCISSTLQKRPSDQPCLSFPKVIIIRNILMPLKEITMSLQSEKADAQLGVKVIHFLKEMARREPALNSPIRTVLSKWVNGNDMVNCLINSSGGFY